MQTEQPAVGRFHRDSKRRWNGKSQVNLAYSGGLFMFLAASANFAHAQTGSGFQFVNVTPCRIADTRLATGPFGGPELSAGSTREFDIPQSACNIPSTAVAYSLNVTVVPNASLGYLTIWSTGQSQPLVPTLTSDGRVKADAAIVPAGSNGGVDVYVTDATQVVLDIDGYFAPAGTTSALAFYPVTPCRVADTRNATGPLGGPKLAAYTSRDFPVQAGGCGIPSTAQAYSLNVTALPQTGYLGYLTLWPTGEAQPLVSTLNSLTGEIVANAAIVPAGAGGDVSIFVTNDADVVLDIDGYFAPPETGGLSLYTVSPCRVMDTRNGAGAFSGTLTINVTGSACAPPSTAQAYVFNVTAAPSGNLAYLTLWPNGGTQPSTSTLQSPDGTVTSNMAVVATTNGSINAYATDPTQLSLDISGYFAPTTSGSTWDSGVITLTVNGVVAASTNYQQGSTPSTIAEGLQSGLTAASPVNVTAIGDGIYLQAKQSGSETNYGYTLTTTSYDSADFGQSSFMNPAATGNLSGGQDAASGQTQIVYSYTAGYDNVGNVINYADSVMGSWQFGYNALNELTSSQNTTVTSTSTQFAGMYGCWSYDDFGNRTAAAMSTTPCNSNPPLQSWATYTTTNTNRMDSTSLNSNQVSGYDAAGDVIYDGRNQYLYDPEGRICAVSFTVSGATTLTGYLYDTDGNRVAKGTLLSWGSCDPAVNGFQTTAVYVGGPSGEQMTEMAVRNNEVTPAHTNVWEGGALLATYDWINGGLHFALADPLGSKRVQVSGTGEAELDCLSLPFGDNLGNAP